MKPTAFYGTDAETFWVAPSGQVWLVQSPDTDEFERVAGLPAGVVQLDPRLCEDLALPGDDD